MSQIIKSYFGVFLILLMMITSYGILAAHMKVMNAQNLHSCIVNDLQDSNFSVRVLQDAYDACEKTGDRLKVILYYQDGGEKIIYGKEDVPKEHKAVERARVELEFPFQTPFPRIYKLHRIVCYA